MRTRLGTEYERVPAEQEVELTELQDIEFGNIEAAEGVEEQAAQTVTRASAEADVEMQEFTDISAEAAPELVEAPEAIAGLTEISGAEAAAITGEEALAVGGETMASAFGVAAEGGLVAAEAGEVGIEGGLAAMEAGEVGLASAAEGAGIELGVLGAEAGVAGGEAAAAAGSGALAGAFNPATDVADVFTFGLASLIGAAVGAGAAAGIAAGVAASKHHDPQPGIKQLSADDVIKLKAKLPADSPARRTMDSAGTRPLYYVTTDSKKNVLVAQLSQGDLAKARAALVAKPDLFLHHDAQTLKAMGINPSLAGRGWSTGTNPFAQRIPPIPNAVQQQAEADHSARTKRKLAQAQATQNAARIAQVTDRQVKAYLTAKLQLYRYNNGLLPPGSPKPVVPAAPNTPESVAALVAYNQRLSKARVRANQSQIALGKAKATQAVAASKLSATTAAAQQRYAAAVTQANVKRQQAVNQYNTQLMSGLHQMADTYLTAVAQTNIQLAQQATAPTRLLGTNIKAAYQVAQQTYTPQSTALPAK